MQPELMPTADGFQPDVNWKHRPEVNQFLRKLSGSERQDALTSAISRHPNDGFLLGHYGKSCVENNDPIQAIGYLLQAMDTETQDASLAFNLGLAYVDMNQPARAIPFLRQAVEIASNPDHTLVLMRVASQAKDFTAIEFACRHGMEHHPLDDRFPCAYVDALIACGELDRASNWISNNDNLDSPRLAQLQYQIHNEIGSKNDAEHYQLEYRRRCLRQQKDYRSRATSVINSIPDRALRGELVQQWQYELSQLCRSQSDQIASPRCSHVEHALSPSVAMSILVRDEVDIIEHNIHYHASVGVQHFVVTDNGSVDGTRELLSELQKNYSIDIIDEPSHSIDQDLWVTRMANQIKSDGRFEWVIHNDADEFWVPQHVSTLPEAVVHSLAMNDEECTNIGVLQCPRVNMLPSQSATEHSDYQFFDNIHAVVNNVPLKKGEEQWNDDGVNTVARHVMDKVMTRSDGLANVEYGNHGATHDMASAKTPYVLIYHYPVRTYQQFERKVVNYGQSLENNTRFSKGSSLHLRYWYKRYLEGKLEQDYAAICFDDAELDSMCDSGHVRVDLSLKNAYPNTTG